MYGSSYVVAPDRIGRGTQPQFRNTQQLFFGNFRTFGSEV